MNQGILLVEDEKSLSRAVSVKLAKEGYQVHSAESIEQARAFYENSDVQMIICDIGLPDGSGLDFCMEVRNRERENGAAKDTVFLFLTAMDTEMDIINGYEAGGDDYVTKPFSLAVLLSKVNAIMERYGGADGKARNGGASECGRPPIMRSGDIVVDFGENRVKKGGAYLSLTANEQKLLLYFLENPLKVLSKNQILEAVWDVDGSFVDDNTVAVNIRRLREKIEDDPSAPSVLKNIRGLGYVWERECEKQ